MGIPGSVGMQASGLPPLGDQANAVLSGQITAVGPQSAFAFRGPMNLEIYASINTALTTTVGSLAATVAAATGLAAGNAIKSANLPGGSTIGAIAGTNVTLAMAPRTHWGVIDSSGKITGNFPTDRLLNATVTVVQPSAEGVTLPAGTTVSAILQANAVPPSGAQGNITPGIIQLSNAPTALPAEGGQVAFLFALTGNGVQATGADAAATFTGALITWSGTVQLERSFDGGSTWIVCNIGASGTLAQWTAGPISITFGEPEKNVLYRLNTIAYTSGQINYRISQTGGAAESLAVGPLSSG
jgi:hypothetical protein